MRGLLAGDKLPDGRELTPDIRRILGHLVATLEHIEPEYALTVNAPPTMGFEKELTIDLGKRVAKVLWLGRANTGGDAVVWIDDVKTLMAGDTVVSPVPFAFGSYMSEWPGVLEKMIEMRPAVVVPGHGPVFHDTRYLETLVEMFRALTTQVKEAAGQGLSLDDTRKRVTLDDFRSRLVGDDVFWQGGFRNAFLGPAVDRAYQEAKGALKPEVEP